MTDASKSREISRPTTTGEMVRTVEEVIHFSSRLMYELATGSSIQVLGYECIVVPEGDQGYRAGVPSLPGCRTEGKDLTELRKNLALAIRQYVGPDRPRAGTSR
jgi:hypothetical protein